MVETTLPQLSAEPSQGSHFFHNITTLEITYCTVNPDRATGWTGPGLPPGRAWLKAVLPPTSACRSPFVIKADGRSSRCVMFLR
jgi:hypothetical protein